MYHQIYGLTLNECIEKLSHCSDAYIEAVLYGKLCHKYSIGEIKTAIEKYRQNNSTKDNCKSKIKVMDKAKTISNIIQKASQQTKVNLNMDKFNLRKNDYDFLKACENQLNAEIVYNEF